MHKYLLSLLLTASTLTAQAQTFNGTGGSIPDDGNNVVFEIPVSGLPTATDTLNWGLESVCLNATHTWVADLSVTLVAPDGTIISLFNAIGGDTDGLVNTCLSGNATQSIFSVWYPFTGTFRPFGDMGLLNKGLNPNGVWKLLILDTYAFADAGDLLNWQITFGDQPCKPFPFTSSDLPIVQITTGGQPIVNDPKITANIKILDNGPGQRNYVAQDSAAFTGTIGIELRGNSSQGMPKKPYSIEFRDAAGNDLDVSILGLPEESDFVLQANFSDKTQMRNALAFEKFRQMGHYATRTRFCEVMIDGSYQGTYVLIEDIKRDKNRLDIAKLDPEDLTGSDLTGGYILRIDWDRTPGWESNYTQPNNPNVRTRFQHLYPKWDEIQPEQQDYIRNYVGSFEDALAGNDFEDPEQGWRFYADELSFVDYLILNEISRNVDGYRLSTYFYKDRDGKLSMGPPWDYDLAWYNADYCDGFLTSGWAYNINYICDGDKNVPFWWERLMEDAQFRENLACRWSSLRQGTLNNLSLKNTIDSMALVINEAQQRNFRQWPILGVYVWPNPGVLPVTYAGEVQKMRNWIYQRAAWMDNELGQYLPNISAEFTYALPASGLQVQFAAQTQAAGYTYFWDFGDGTTSTEMNPAHTYSTVGTYEVNLTVRSPFGCGETDEQVVSIFTDTRAQTFGAGGLRAFPNPAEDVLWITAEQPGDWQGTLRNGLGQVVHSFSGRQQQRWSVDLRALPAGSYWLEMTGQKGVYREMVVKG